jgi:L-lactate utilization protein LutB
MELKIDNLIKNWQKRNIPGFFCETKETAARKILEIIPQSATVGISGSVTLDQLEIVKQLESRGNKVLNQYKPGLAKEESLETRRLGATQADFYLASANAVSQNGELVFLSAFGNRTAGISNARNVVIVCGINKLTPNLTEALKRAKEVATPLNYKRLNWDKSRPMCCQVLVIEAEVSPDRLKVILVGENLGF